MSDQVNLYGYVLALSVPTAVTQQQDRAACYNILIDDNKLLDYVDVIRLGNETLAREALHDKAEIHFAQIGTMLGNQEYRLKRAVDQEVMMYADFAVEMTQCDTASLQKVPAILMNLNTTRLRDHVQSCMHDVVTPAGQMANDLVIESVRSYLDSPNRVTVEAHRLMDWANANMSAALADCDPTDDVVVKYDTEFKDNLTRMAEITGRMVQLESTLLDQLSDRSALRDTLTDITTQFSEFNTVRDRVYDGINELDRYRESLPAKEIQAAVESLEASIAEWVDGEPIDAEGADEEGIALESDKPNIIVRIWNWIVEQIKAFGKWIAKVWGQFIGLFRKKSETVEKELDTLEKEVKEVEKEAGETLTVEVADSSEVKQQTEVASALKTAEAETVVVNKPVAVSNVPAVERQLKLNAVAKAKLDENSDALTKSQVIDGFSRAIDSNIIRDVEKGTAEKSAAVFAKHLVSVAIVETYLKNSGNLGKVKQSIINGFNLLKTEIRDRSITAIYHPDCAPDTLKHVALGYLVVKTLYDLDDLDKSNKPGSSYDTFKKAFSYLNGFSADFEWTIDKIEVLFKLDENPKFLERWEMVQNEYNLVEKDLKFDPATQSQNELMIGLNERYLDSKPVVDQKFIDAINQLARYKRIGWILSSIYGILANGFSFDRFKENPASLTIVAKNAPLVLDLIKNDLTYAYTGSLRPDDFLDQTRLNTIVEWAEGKAIPVRSVFVHLKEANEAFSQISESGHKSFMARLNEMEKQIADDAGKQSEYSHEELANIAKNIAASNKMMVSLFENMGATRSKMDAEFKQVIPELRALVRQAKKGK